MHTTAGGYLLQHHSKLCSSLAMVATIEECSRAKAALDPRAGEVDIDDSPNAPKGCSRFQGKWYFNTNAKGEVDGASEPVCKVTPGNPGKSQRTCACA